MNGISSWIAGLSAVTLIVSVVSVTAPKNSAGRVCSMIGSILVIVALISPVFDFDSSSFSAIGKAYEERVSHKVAEMTAETDKIKKDIIEERLAAYVLNRAGTDGSVCTLYIETEGEVAVSATVITRDTLVAERVSQVLSEELKLSDSAQEIKTEV